MFRAAWDTESKLNLHAHTVNIPSPMLHYIRSNMRVHTHNRFERVQLKATMDHLVAHCGDVGLAAASHAHLHGGKNPFQGRIYSVLQEN